jgi:hypothetical protein
VDAKVKVIEVSEKDVLMVKQIKGKLKVGWWNKINCSVNSPIRL